MQYKKEYKQQTVTSQTIKKQETTFVQNYTRNISNVLYIKYGVDL